MTVISKSFVAQRKPEKVIAADIQTDIRMAALENNAQIPFFS